MNSVIGTSVEGRRTSSSLSGKNEGREEAFAQEAERKPGRSARGSRSKSSSRDGSTLKGLVKGVGAAGSSKASGRASFRQFWELSPNGPLASSPNFYHVFSRVL